MTDSSNVQKLRSIENVVSNSDPSPLYDATIDLALYAIPISIIQLSSALACLYSFDLLFLLHFKRNLIIYPSFTKNPISGKVKLLTPFQNLEKYYYLKLAFYSPHCMYDFQISLGFLC